MVKFANQPYEVLVEIFENLPLFDAIHLALTNKKLKSIFLSSDKYGSICPFDLEVAAYNGLFDVVVFIHTYVIKYTNIKNLNAINIAARGGHNHIVKWLHSNGHQWSLNVLFHCAYVGNVSLIRFLCQERGFYSQDEWNNKRMVLDAIKISLRLCQVKKSNTNKELKEIYVEITRCLLYFCFNTIELDSSDYNQLMIISVLYYPSLDILKFIYKICKRRNVTLLCLPKVIDIAYELGVHDFLEWLEELSSPSN